MAKVTGFYKGNDLWKKSVAAKRAKGEKIDALMGMIAGGGMDRYAEIMDKLSQGDELTKGEEQFMDRLEGWRPWVRPKLSSVEQKTDLNLKVEKIEQLESTLRFIAGVGNKGGGSNEDEGSGKEPVQG